ncbi:MAG: hypothetical protein IPM82_12055 [Saprospiraceae bacterium]|nr:hypothetical protein [Saprospiraceae bacterium]
MLKGIQLTLLIGPIVPVPVPKVVLEALMDISVSHQEDGKSGFQLSFEIGKNSLLQTLFLLIGGQQIPPFLRTIIIVTLNGSPTVIMDGVITNTEHRPPSAAGAKSLLTISGVDLSSIMDRQDFSGFPFPAVPAEGRVALLIAKYSFLGLIPLVIPSVLIDVPIPTSRIPSQRGTDLSYIQHLAEEVGYVFYIEPGPAPGTNFAYWGPQIKVGVPQPALNVDMDAHNNVESLSFNFDNSLNSIPTVFYYDEISKAVIPIPIPPITPLNPPLGLISPIPTKLEPIQGGLSKYSMPKAIMIGLAKASKWAEAVSGEGELDVLRYGRILKARQLVGVRGAGLAFNGLYYVKSVTHNIKRGSYKQSFALSRNGLISTLQRVVP